MWRWAASLVVMLGLLAAGTGSTFWLLSRTAARVEDVRLVRAQHQQLEQQLARLQSPGIAPLIVTLQEDLDALQIKLVEVVTLKPLPAGVIKVGYEQAILPQIMDVEAGETVNVLRLELTLTLLHSRGLLDMLDRIDSAAGAWPQETRACELLRLPLQMLSAQCVVDFYHWSDTRELESVQLKSLPSGSPRST